MGGIISPMKYNCDSNCVSVKLVLGENLTLGEHILELLTQRGEFIYRNEVNPFLPRAPFFFSFFCSIS